MMETTFDTQLKICYEWLPIAATVITGLILIISLIDLKYQKCQIKTVVWVLFLAVTGITAYSAGFFIYKFIATMSDPGNAASLTDDEKAIIADALDQNLDTLQEWWDLGVALIKNWGDIGSWAPVAVLISACTSLVSAIYYACLSCCVKGDK